MNLRFLALVLLTATLACCQDKPKDAPAASNQSVTPKEFEKAVSVITTTQSQNQQTAKDAIKAVSEDSKQVVQIQKKEEETKKILDLVKQQTEEDRKQTEEDLIRAQRKQKASGGELNELRKAIEGFEGKMEHEAHFNSILSYILLGIGLAFGLVSFTCGLMNYGKASAIFTFLIGLVIAVNTYSKFDNQAHLYTVIASQAAALKRSVQPEGLLQGQYLDANETLGKLLKAEYGADKGNIDETLQPFTNKPTTSTR